MSGREGAAAGGAGRPVRLLVGEIAENSTVTLKVKSNELVLG